MLSTAPPVHARVQELTWTLVACAVLVQIVYPLIPLAERTPVTVLSVVVFAAAALADVVRLHGTSGALWLLAVAGGGGLAAEAVGQATGVPFGAYAYTGTLGPELIGVPIVVPLAWIMMAWPALVVGRTSARSAPAVVAVGAVALTAWDVFLDPQMVEAGHWRWLDAGPALPLVPGIPLTNYGGWLLVSGSIVGVLHFRLPEADRPARPSGPATALYLWVYASSVVAHLTFFDLPGSALVGGVLMGAVTIPFARAVWRGRRVRDGGAQAGPVAPARPEGRERGRADPGVGRPRRDRAG